NYGNITDLGYCTSNEFDAWAGWVYNRYLRESNSYISVKRASMESKKGIKEYATEVRIIIHQSIALALASGLLYLYEEWEEYVVHRDIKSSNIMLDTRANLIAKLGDGNNK
ncbi:hypothetical protein H5410_051760, partial [Solanum commersonii]